MNVFLLFCLSAETVGKKKVSTNLICRFAIDR